MVYTGDLLIWGNVITKEAIRVSTWLRTSALPAYMFIHDANVVRFGNGRNVSPQKYQELHLPLPEVLAFHIKPPDCDPLDYDSNEEMRKMDPTSALVGWFKFDGFIRMSVQTNLERFLDVTKETYISFYDVDISQPENPSMGVIRIPFALLRGDKVFFSPRNGN